MSRILFHEPLTALEIRDPLIDVCSEVAKNFDLFANFRQYRQAAFDNYSYGWGPRIRIGNGKHKGWRVDFQAEPLKTNQPRAVGRLMLLGPIIPDEMQFGGFDYGKHGEAEPRYSYITVEPGEQHYPPLNPPDQLYELAIAGLKQHFEQPYPALFDAHVYIAS